MGKILLSLFLCQIAIAAEKPLVKNAQSLFLKGSDCHVPRDLPKGLSSCNLDIPGGRERLARRLDPLYFHRDLTREDLLKLKIAVGKYFFQKGRPFVRVTIPEQDVTGGVIQLSVTESHVGEVRTEGNKYFSSEKLLSYFRTRPGDVIREKPIADDLYFININPYRQADVIFTPGTELNTTDIILQVWDRKPWRIYSGFDDTGIVGTERNRWFAGFETGNMFWLDHILTYQYTSALNFHSFQGHTIDYVAPLSWRHTLNVYGGYSVIHADLDFPAGKNTGRSYQASLRYDVPMHSDQFLRYKSRFGFDFKRTNSALFFEEIPFSIPTTPFTFQKNVNLTQLMYGWEILCQKNRFNIEWHLEGYWSPGKWIADQTNADYESIRPGAKNHWVYGRTQLIYEQKIFAGMLARFRVDGQLSSQNLLPSEQLPLGGYNSVRGYDERQESKDSGVLASFELRTPLWPMWWKKKENKWQLLGFIDYGWGTNHTPLPGEPKKDWMLGVGPGFRYTFTPYMTARVDWGWKLHRRAFYTGGESQVHFSIVGSY